MIKKTCILFFLLYATHFLIFSQPEKITTVQYPQLVDEGKRIFYRENDSIGKSRSCITCHYMGIPDTLNWNPDAYTISRSSADYDLERFSNLFLLPMESNRLMEAHEGLDLTEEEILKVRIFLSSIRHKDMPSSTLPIGSRLTFWIFILILLGAASKLIFIKSKRSRYMPWLFIVSSITALAVISSGEVRSLGLQINYKPEQPIKFSHRIHCTDNKIDCSYCHNGASVAGSAGFPSTGTCMNCHNLIREGELSGVGEIKKVTDSWDQKRPIKWIQVHNLPDHAVFRHVQHTIIGGLECTDCHGVVEEMDQIQQVARLDMAWCLDCHSKTNITAVSENYYSSTFQIRNNGTHGTRIVDSLTVREVGGWDCIKCHH